MGENEPETAVFAFLFVKITCQYKISTNLCTRFVLYFQYKIAIFFPLYPFSFQQIKELYFGRKFRKKLRNRALYIFLYFSVLLKRDYYKN